MKESAGGQGFFCDVRSLDGLVDGLERLLNQSDFDSKPLIERARKLRWANTAQELSQIYSKIL